MKLVFVEMKMSEKWFEVDGISSQWQQLQDYTVLDPMMVDINVEGVKISVDKRPMPWVSRKDYY